MNLLNSYVDQLIFNNQKIQNYNLKSSATQSSNQNINSKNSQDTFDKQKKNSKIKKGKEILEIAEIVAMLLLILSFFARHRQSQPRTIQSVITNPRPPIPPGGGPPPPPPPGGGPPPPPPPPSGATCAVGIGNNLIKLAPWYKKYIKLCSKYGETVRRSGALEHYKKLLIRKFNEELYFKDHHSIKIYIKKMRIKMIEQFCRMGKRFQWFNG